MRYIDKLIKEELKKIISESTCPDPWYEVDNPYAIGRLRTNPKFCVSKDGKCMRDRDQSEIDGNTPCEEPGAVKQTDNEVDVQIPDGDDNKTKEKKDDKVKKDDKKKKETDVEDETEDETEKKEKKVKRRVVKKRPKKQDKSTIESKYDSYCWVVDLFKKNCVDKTIKQLQINLNKITDDGIGKVPETGYWEDLTQKKIEKNYPQFKTGMKQKDIDDINKKLEDKYKVQPLKKAEDEKETWTEYGEWGERKRLKESTDGTDKSALTDEKFFKEYVTTYNYCLPKWFQKYGFFTLKSNKGKSIGYLKGYKLYPNDGTTDDSGIPDDTEYRIYRNLKMKNMNSDKETQLECSNLTNWEKALSMRSPYYSLLNSFGLSQTKYATDEEFVNGVNKVTKKINDYLALGYKSDNFTTWSEFLSSVANLYTGLESLSTKENLSYTTIPETQKASYTDESGDVARREFWSIQIYRPTSGKEMIDTTPETGLSKQQCKQTLMKYLRQAIIVAAKAGNVPMTNDYTDMRREISWCKAQNRYSDNDTFPSGEVFGPSEQSYASIEKSPFKKYNDPLTYKQIVKFLSGKDRYNILGKQREYTGEYLIRPSIYIFNELNESYEMKDKIKSTLTEVVEEKKKMVLQEKVLRNRVNLMLENTEFKSRKDRRIFVINLLQESFLLERQGFSKELIKEEFWDVIKGFFGDKGSRAVFKSFKTRMGEWLTSHLSPKKADGWIGDCIRKTVQEIDMEDVHLITDCKFLTRKISRSVVEKLKEKMSNDELRDEGLYDVVRGGMASNVSSAKFRSHIEDKVGKMICPILYDMSNKFDATFEKMRKKTLEIFD